MGWGRVVVYLWHRVGRLHGTPHSIADGFACGAAISFTPFVGAHFILAALTSWFSRGNIIAGLIGTAVGNPWTFPFIWWWTYTLGTKMGAGTAVTARPDVLGIVVDLPGVVARAALRFDIDWTYLDNLWAVIWPMMVGSVPTFIVVWLTTYALVKPMVAAYQTRRIARRRRKLQKELATKAQFDDAELDISPLPVGEHSDLAGDLRRNRKSSG